MKESVERESATTPETLEANARERAPVLANRVAAVRARVRERIAKLGLARSPIMLGVPEVAGLSAALLLLAASVVAYFYLLAPAQRNLREAETKKASEQRKLAQADNSAEGATPQATVPEIVNSIRRFEQVYLPLQTEGRTAVIIELNEAVARNNLRNAGYDFTTLDAIGEAGQGARRSISANAKLQSAFPGFGITLSVVGTYGNLRRFIRDIEASGQFVVVDSVELEGTREAEGGGTLVNLRLGLAAYFRPDAPPTETGAAASEPAAQ